MALLRLFAEIHSKERENEPTTNLQYRRRSQAG